MPPSESLKLPLFSEELALHFTRRGRSVEGERGRTWKIPQVMRRFRGERDMGFVEGTRLMVKGIVVTQFGGFDLLSSYELFGKYSMQLIQYSVFYMG